MHSIEGALRMSDEINAQFGFERVFGKTNGNADTDTKITKFGISFNSDGTTTFFAQLEKSSKLRFRQIQKKNFWIRSKTLTGIPSSRRRIKSAEDLIFQFSLFR